MTTTFGQMIIDKETLNCNGRLFLLDRPKVMGILNVTPDSFFSGSRVQEVDAAITRASSMISEGASIIDIGGVSTRPGAEEVSTSDEKKRVLPIIKALHEEHPEVIISIDTYNSKVAIAAVEAGASIINDVSAGRIDEQMYDAVGELNVPYILMHMQGLPRTMQTSPNYNNVGLEVLDFFIAEIDKLRKRHIPDIILDPGFGFGKTVAHNYELLNSIHAFRFLRCPVMTGLSRKSMIYKPLGITADEALNGTTALHMKALIEGSKLLRVHDVKAAVETVRLFELLEANQPKPN